MAKVLWMLPIAILLGCNPSPNLSAMDCSNHLMDCDVQITEAKPVDSKQILDDIVAIVAGMMHAQHHPIRRSED